MRSMIGPAREKRVCFVTKEGAGGQMVAFHHFVKERLLLVSMLRASCPVGGLANEDGQVMICPARIRWRRHRY